MGAVAALTAFVIVLTGATATDAATKRERRLAERVERLTAKLEAKNELLADTQAENARLWADNAKLRDGLPNAILAVSVSDFWRLVFTPARQAWRCDYFYSDANYWALTFERSC